MDTILIPIGVAYEQVMADFRAMLRSELGSLIPAPATAHPALADELLSVREAAEMLGVTVQTIHSWKQKGMLRYHKLGSRSYLKKADVMKALQGIQRTAKPGKATPAKPFTTA